MVIEPHQWLFKLNAAAAVYHHLLKYCYLLIKSVCKVSIEAENDFVFKQFWLFVGSKKVNAMDIAGLFLF